MRFESMEVEDPAGMSAYCREDTRDRCNRHDRSLAFVVGDMKQSDRLN